MRPEILFPVFADVETLDGVGEKTAKLYRKARLGRVIDLLTRAPVGMTDRRLRPTLQGAAAGEIITIEATIGRHVPPGRPGAPWRVAAKDSQLDFQIIFFKADNRYLERMLPTGAVRLLSGKVELYDGVAQMPHPDYILDPDEADQLPLFEPAYPLFAGVGRRSMARTTLAALELAPDLPEWLDAPFKAQKAWPGWRDALTTLHRPRAPKDLAAAPAARARLAYDEMLAHQVALAIGRAVVTRQKGRSSPSNGALTGPLLKAFGHRPTSAQNRAFAEIAADMAEPDRMLRLLQGDVGAGKTLVAALALATAVEAGGQGALMAPTEILAAQHLDTLEPLFASLGVSVALLTGRDKGAARRAKAAAVAEGRTQIVIGTHALFQKDAEFADLRLIVIDEQHRFGVAQRARLAEKGGGQADILVMTATPIPRTLALASYGDMDVSVLDEKPPGRLPIDTRMVSLTRYNDVVEGVARAIKQGRRVYWVCPLVEESDKIDVAAAEHRAQALRLALGAEHIALAHGRLTPAQKDEAMGDFAAGRAHVLVATTVIEVGVDVPEAAIMVIEHAERFGLAQLHQLRGRVGRGSEKSSCILLYQGPLGDVARTRLGALRESEDGFQLAEQDLQLRGAGDLIGLKQAGTPNFRLADLDMHADLMEAARDDARLILITDPDLATPRGQALRVLLALFERDGGAIAAFRIVNAST